MRNQEPAFDSVVFIARPKGIVPLSTLCPGSVPIAILQFLLFLWQKLKLAFPRRKILVKHHELLPHMCEALNMWINNGYRIFTTHLEMEQHWLFVVSCLAWLIGICGKGIKRNHVLVTLLACAQPLRPLCQPNLRPLHRETTISGNPSYLSRTRVDCWR